MRNIAYIETVTRSGSGVVLKCDCDTKNGLDISDNEDTYIILTNYHVLRDLDANVLDHRKYIDIEIFDVNGKIIDSNDITHVYFASGNNYDNSSDVAALLLTVKKICNVLYSNKISFDHDEKMSVCSEGYPHVVQDDDINRIINIEGKIEKYNQDGIGIYKILDEYHWYPDIPDKVLFEGLSGAPIYANDMGAEMLIGINQSLCNIGGGKNPFKVVYFLPIKNVLMWLRSQGIILFQYYKNEVDIIWINKIKVDDIEESRTVNNEKHIVLLGSSGAGKSSFAKSFCLYGNKIDSSGDGQTTRDMITYKLETYCESPQITIKFQDKKEFLDSKMKLIEFRLIELICCEKFGMRKKDIMTDNMQYLRDFLLPMEFLCTQIENDKIVDVVKNIKETLFVCQDNYDVVDYEDKVLKCYSSIFSLLEGYLDGQDGFVLKLLKLKYLLNKDCFDKWIKENNMKGPSDYYNYIWDNDDLVDDCRKASFYDNLKKIVERSDGYFDIGEFEFLFTQNTIREKSKKTFNDIFDTEDIHTNKLQHLDSNDELIKIEDGDEIQNAKPKTLKGKMYKYYEEIYKFIYQGLTNVNIMPERNQVYMLKGITRKELDIVTKCLKIVNGSSLTGIVKSIVWEDSYSNEYSVALYEKGIDKIVFYDTCGLDHIDRGDQRELYFTNIFNNIRDQRKKSLDAIFYVKKLDSGKPVELEKMIPILGKLEPATPIYCIFTGADQFYKDKDSNIHKIKWNQENYKRNKEYKDIVFPKVVSYLYENKLNLNELKVAPVIQEKIYEFIIDNIIPFAAKIEIEDWLVHLNRNSIGNVISSLLIDEWNTGFVNISDEQFKDDNKETILRNAINSDLELMFKYSSEKNWYLKHNMTVEANFRRLFRYNSDYDSKNPTLGFNRTQINRWDNMLQSGYKKSFLNEGETQKILVEYGIKPTKAYSLLSRLRDSVLLNDMSMWRPLSETCDTKDVAFRDIFVSMYESERNNFKWNPFKRQETPQFSYYQKIAYLDDVTDFAKGLKCRDISERFNDYIYQRITDMLKDENTRCLELLYEYDEEFRKCVDHIEHVIKKHSWCDTLNGNKKDSKNQSYYGDVGLFDLLNNIVF